MTNENQIVLSARLGTIAELIAPGSRVADIGTDHGYLPIWLLQTGRAAFAAACDVREGPLDHARRSAAQWGVQEKMIFRLGDGLACIAPEEVDTIVIAGMGGETISAILEGALWTNQKSYQLLLQPMTKAELLRPWLAEHGYRFISEHLVWENNAYFPIMEVTGGGTPEKLTLGQQWGGVALDDDPLQEKALEENIRRHSYAVSGLEKSSAPDSAEKAKQHRAVIAALEEMKERVQYADNGRD